MKSLPSLTSNEVFTRTTQQMTGGGLPSQTSNETSIHKHSPAMRGCSHRPTMKGFLWQPNKWVVTANCSQNHYSQNPLVTAKTLTAQQWGVYHHEHAQCAYAAHISWGRDTIKQTCNGYSEKCGSKYRGSLDASIKHCPTTHLLDEIDHLWFIIAMSCWNRMQRKAAISTSSAYFIIIIHDITVIW